MTSLKLKFGIGMGAIALLTGGVPTVAFCQESGGDTITAQQIAQQAQDAYAALSSYSDSGKTISEAAGSRFETTFNIRLQRPNLYRIDWTQAQGAYTNKGVVWSDGSGDYFAVDSAAQKASAEPQKMQNMQMALAAGTGVSGQASATIPGTFFNQGWGDVLRIPASGRFPAKKEQDQAIGGVDCYVISSGIDIGQLPNAAKLPANAGKTTTTLWIGKKDHLIHQVQTTIENLSFVPPKQSDSDISNILKLQGKPVTPEAIAATRTELERSAKQAQGALKSGKVILTETHEKIATNPKLSPSDFAK